MELETSRMSINSRDKEIHEGKILQEETLRGMRENYKDLESNYLILGETNKSLEERLQTLNREIGILRNKEENTHKANKSLIGQLKESEERIIQQISDIVALNEKLAAKHKEMDELEAKYRELQRGNMEEGEKKKFEDEKEKKILVEKNEKLELQVDDLQREVKVLKSRQEDLIRASEIRLNVLKVEQQQEARAQKVIFYFFEGVLIFKN